MDKAFARQVLSQSNTSAHRPGRPFNLFISCLAPARVSERDRERLAELGWAPEGSEGFRRYT